MTSDWARPMAGNPIVPVASVAPALAAPIMACRRETPFCVVIGFLQRSFLVGHSIDPITSKVNDGRSRPDEKLGSILEGASVRGARAILAPRWLYSCATQESRCGIESLLLVYDELLQSKRSGQMPAFICTACGMQYAASAT